MFDCHVLPLVVPTLFTSLPCEIRSLLIFDHMSLAEEQRKKDDALVMRLAYDAWQNQQDLVGEDIAKGDSSASQLLILP